MHAYDKKGNPVYEVPNISKGGMRPTTVADVRKLKLVPSVTELTNQLNKAGLIRYQINQVLEECIRVPFTSNQKVEWYKSQRLQYIERESNKPRDLGTVIHDKLEKWFKKETDELCDNTRSAVLKIRADIGEFDYIAEQSFADRQGFGGKVDLHLPTNDGIVIDYKTKNTLDIHKVKGYKEHIMQLAAYRMGLAIPKAKCYNVFISSMDTTLVKIVQYSEKELSEAWEMFKCLLRFWQIDNKMEVLV